jgi:integrase
LAYAPESGVVQTEGKTGKAGHRVVAIDADLVAELKAHRVAQVEMALAAGLPKPVWVFSHDAGVTPWRPDHVSREFRRLRDKAGVPSTVRLHDLRHFVATELLAAGVPLKVVSERLGHRQLSTTADTYGHYVPAADKEAADVMARLRHKM